MTTSLLIPLVGNQLGNSLALEEYKGNYKRASEVATSSLEAARQSGDTIQLTEALLAAGTVQLVQGRPAAARRCFAEAEQCAKGDGARQLYAVNGSILATYYASNLFPGWGGSNGDEDTGSLQAYIEGQSQRRSDLRRVLTDPADQLTDRLMSDLLANILPMRSVMELSYTAPAANAEQLLEVALSVPIRFRQQAEALAADSILLAYTLLAAADLAWRARRSDLAPAFLQEALSRYAEANDAAGAATCHMTWGDWLAAPFSSPLKWNFALQTNGSEGSNLSWVIEDVEFTQQGANIEQALGAYQQAATLFEQADAPRGLAALQLRYGYLAMLRDDYPAAVAYAREASRAFSECGDEFGYMTAQTHAIMSGIGAGEAAKQYELAEEIGHWGATEGSFSYARGLGTLVGRAARHWVLRGGDYERALAGYHLSETLFKALGTPAYQVQSLVDQANVNYAIGEPSTAIILYEQALDLYEATILTHPHIAAMLRSRIISLAVNTYNLAVRTVDANEIERSAARLQKQLQQIPNLPDNISSMLDALTGRIGKAMGGEADQDEPMQLVDWALRSLAQSTVDQASVLVPLYHAQRARDDGDEETAQRLFATALRAARSVSSDEADWLEATVLGQQKQYDQARAAFERYIRRGASSAGFIGQLVNVLSAVGSTGQAELRRQQERNASLAFTFMVRIKAHQEAFQYYEQLRQLGGDDWWDHDARSWLDLSDCAEMYEGLGQFAEASAFYDKAIAAFEERRKLLSRDELKTAMAADKGAQYLYFLAARAALKLSVTAQQNDDQVQARNYAAYAFDYMERGRARALLDLMAGSAVLAGTSDTETQTLRDWRRITAQLTVWRGLLAQERRRVGSAQPEEHRMAALEQQIVAGEAKLRGIEAQLGVANPLLHQALNSQAQVITAEQVSAALEPGTVLLEYAFLGDDLLVWAFTEAGIAHTYSLAVDAKTLTRQIRNLHRVCEARAQWEPLAVELSKILLAPLDEIIQNSQHLIIVPYGAAHALPFHILPWKGQPLICTRAVSYLPSASVLRFLERPHSELPQRLLAIGNPTRMSYTPLFSDAPVPLKPLRAAETEALFVASLFQEGRALVGDEATEAAVVQHLGAYPLLHLATHGYLSEDAPLLSAIVLANGESLSVYELMGLRLNADLVVLSACNTAQGETTGGDDVLGLTRGLLATGARSAVVSLWPVDDISTSLLMGQFYRELRRGTAPETALQLAQQYLRRLNRNEIRAEIDKLHVDLTSAGVERDVINLVVKLRDTRRSGAGAADDYSHPFFWAPFILVGA